MNLARISKKSPHFDSRQTLVALHNEKMLYFKKYYETLPEKKKKLDQLICRGMSQNINVSVKEYEKKSREQDQLEKKINLLRDEIERMEHRVDEAEYLLKASPFLEKYSKIKDNQHENSKTENYESDGSEEECDKSKDSFSESFEIKGLSKYVNEKNVSTKGRICEEYSRDCLGHIMGSVHKEMVSQGKNLTQQLKCLDCRVPRQLIHNEAIAVCPECGDSIIYQDRSIHMEFSDEIEVLSPFAYKRINHFKEWLSQLQLELKSILFVVSSHYNKINNCNTGFKLILI